MVAPFSTLSFDTFFDTFCPCIQQQLRRSLSQTSRVDDPIRKKHHLPCGCEAIQAFLFSILKGVVSFFSLTWFKRSFSFNYINWSLHQLWNQHENHRLWTHHFRRFHYGKRLSTCTWNSDQRIAQKRKRLTPFGKDLGHPSTAFGPLLGHTINADSLSYGLNGKGCWWQTEPLR